MMSDAFIKRDMSLEDYTAIVEITEQGSVLLLRGNWSVDYLRDADDFIRSFIPENFQVATLKADAIINMDTAGALLLQKLHKKSLQKNPTAAIAGLSENYQSLVQLISEKIQKTHADITVKRNNLLYRIGKYTYELYQHALDMLGFLGELFVLLFATLMQPVKFQVRSMVHEIDLGGYRALPIIAVMMFLIGVVIAYQLGVQLQIYGANEYLVDLSGVAILREFSPLISSVIIAGRTSTAFAALIGTMKVNEEIDALRTMGLSPVERLVLPKILGLLIALPLLVVWGDIFGVLGSMVMGKSMMGFSYQAFLMRFKQEVAVKHLYLGLIKTPVFALIIAGIGCFQGFQAEGSAESVGLRTTKAAVQAIFLIILADGLFSILFNWMNV